MAPFFSEGEVAGLISLNEHSRTRRYTRIEKDFVEKLAGIISAALENARLLEGRRQSQRQAEALTRISEAMLETVLDPVQVMDRVVSEAAKAMEVEKAAIALREEEFWAVRHGFALEPGQVHTVLSDADAHLAVLAAATRRSVVVDDVDQDPRLRRDLVQSLGLRSALVVPLLIKSRVAGVMYFGHGFSERPFTREKVQLAERIAASVAVALENARLYLTERRMARTLQAALLTVPEHVPDVSFGHLHGSASPNAEVGGDFYDIFDLPDHRLGVIIGDVSGKGVEGAAMASLAKNLLKAYAYEGASPAEVLRRTNEALLLNSYKGSFTTAFLAILDLGQHRFVYANAGHPPPILAHDARSVELLPDGSGVLGALPGEHYAEGTARLDRGDLLLLYTDGATEARRISPDGKPDLFGEERLGQLVKQLGEVQTPPERVPEVLYREILDFTEGTLPDDIALLCLAPRR
jgi:serine phosphatase RsbU (regulator of sigma subunit)